MSKQDKAVSRSAKRAAAIALVWALLVTFVFPITAFAAPQIIFTMNGNAQRYAAGANLIIYGQISDSAMPVSGADIVVNVTLDDAQVFTAVVKSKSNGYFNTGFNLPKTAAVGQTAKFTASYGSTVSYEVSVPIKEMEYNDFLGFTFPAYMSKGEFVRTVDAASIKEFGLVFQGNVNYFRNRSNSLGLESLGPNTRNADCITMYEDNTNTKVKTNVNLISGGGDESMEYYDKDTLTSETTTRKDCLKFTAAQPLKEGTVYRIEISGELTGNSSNFLGINQIVYFKTAGGQDAPEPDDPGSDNPSKSGSGSDPIVIDPLNPEPVLTDTGITIKSAEAKSPSRQLPVNTQLIVKPIDVSVSDASGKQLSYLEEKTPFAFVADLNDIENLNSIMIYVLVDGAWVYIPSVADAETGKITVSTHHVGEFIICRNTLVEQLTDLADDKYLEPIKTLIALGLVEGITQSDGTMAFDGEENLEIADFAKILCGVLRIGVSTVDIGAGNGLFADWDATPLLAKMYILALYNSGVFEGINEDGRLYAGAEQLLTGEQMFVLLCRGLEIDYTEDESWAGDARNSLDLLGLVDPAMADATAPCTRKEMAYTVGLLLQLLSEDELDDAIAQAAAATPDEDEPDADEVHEES